MKKKLLFINFEMPVGGIERSLLGLLNTLDYSKYEVDLFLYQHSGDFLNQLPKDVNLLPERPVYKIFCGGISNCFKKGYWLLGLIRILAKLYTQFRNKIIQVRGCANSYGVRYYKWSIPFLPRFPKEYDAIFSYQTPHFTALSRFNGNKKIGFIHTDYSTIDIDHDSELPMWQQLDTIVAISEECKTVFLSVFPGLKNKVVVVENILSDVFVRMQAEQKDVSVEMPGDTNLKICSVGRFCYQKAFDDAIRSAALLKQKKICFKWYFIGFGPDEVIMRQLIAENSLQNECIILGKKITPYPYMKRADLYVQPSRFEGKAVTVREAQMLGKPVLITNYATASSQITHDKDGVICPMGIENVAIAIEELINTPIKLQQLSDYCLSQNFGNLEEIKKIEALI